MIRKRVALGAASGIAHLHHHCKPAIIHHDISASNILLNEKLDAVLGDFGIARLMNDKDAVKGSVEWILPIHHLNSFSNNRHILGSIYCYSDVYVTTTVCGTPGYIAPDYLFSGKCTTKSDVYAFGIVLLELFIGQTISNLSECANRCSMLIVNRLSGLSFSKLLNSWVDQNLMHEAQVELVGFVQLALHCLQDNPALRPNMLEVLAILESLSHPECDEEKRHNLAVPGPSNSHSTSDRVEESVVSPLAISLPFEEAHMAGLSMVPFPPQNTMAMCSPSQFSNSLLSTKAEIKKCPEAAICESLVTPECDEGKKHYLAIPVPSISHSTSGQVEESVVSPLVVSLPFEETHVTGPSMGPVPPQKTMVMCSSQFSNSLLSTKAEIKNCPNGLTISSRESAPEKSLSGYPQSSSQEPSPIDGLLKSINKEWDINLTSDLYRNNVVVEEKDENSSLKVRDLRKRDGETTEAPNESLVQATMQRDDYSHEVISTETLLLDEYVSITPSLVSLEELEELFVNLKTKVSASLPAVPIEDHMIPKKLVSKAELLEAMEIIECTMAMPPCSQSINLMSINSAFSKLKELENAGLRVGVAFDVACVKQRTFEAISILSKANDTIGDVDLAEKRMLSLDESFESAHSLFTGKRNSLTQVLAEINVLEMRLASLKLLESKLRGDINNLYCRAAQDGEELSRLKHSWSTLAKKRKKARREKEQAIKDWESLRALIILCKQQV